LAGGSRQNESKNIRSAGSTKDTTRFDAFNIHPISISNLPRQVSIDGVSLIGNAPALERRTKLELAGGEMPFQ
jgi:hypothetical protein